jgi:hypothetical protein
LPAIDRNPSPEISMVVHTCNPSTWEAEAEAGRSEVLGQPGLYNKILFQKKKKKEKEKNPSLV